MNIYRNILAKLPISSSDQARARDTLGGKVMHAATTAGWTTAANMTQITGAFYLELVSAGWRWTPAKSCGSKEQAAKLLDGEMVHAECQAVARAFEMLLQAPAPNGFGAAGAKMVTYSGDEQLIGADNGQPTAPSVKRSAVRGFYSRHPILGIHGLMPNVYDPAVGRITDLYRWDDHKVVELAGKYWDVCYNASYTFLQQMAVAIRLGMNEDRSPTASIVEAMSRVSEDKVVIKNFHQIAYFRTAAPGTTEEAAGARVIGPYYASLFGDEATYGAPTAAIQW
jgi:hypothetical protein